MMYLRLNEREARVAKSMAREYWDELRYCRSEGRYIIPAVGCTGVGLIHLLFLFFTELDYQAYIEGYSWYTRPEPVTAWQWLVTVCMIIVGLVLFVRGYISDTAAEDAQ